MKLGDSMAYTNCSLCCRSDYTSLVTVKHQAHVANPQKDSDGDTLDPRRYGSKSLESGKLRVTML